MCSCVPKSIGMRNLRDQVVHVIMLATETAAQDNAAVCTFQVKQGMRVRTLM